MAADLQDYSTKQLYLNSDYFECFDSLPADAVPLPAGAVFQPLPVDAVFQPLPAGAVFRPPPAGAVFQLPAADAVFQPLPADAETLHSFPDIAVR